MIRPPRHFPQPIVLTADMGQLIVAGNPQPPLTENPPESEVTFNPLEWNTKLQEGQITFAEFIEKLNELDISYQVCPCANNKNKANIKYEYNGFPYVFNVDMNVINGAAPKPEEPSVPTFTKDELAGLDDAAIARYFVANADGTYSFNEENIKADFPEKDYGKINTPTELKEAIAKKAEADQASSVAGAGGTNGAGNTPSVPTFTKDELSGLDDAAIARYFVANADGTYSFNEENIKADFPDRKIETPAQLKEALAKKAEVDGAGGAADTPTGDFKTLDDIRSYLFGIFRSDSDIKNLKFDIGFSYEEIAASVADMHKEDFATVTKEQLKEEFIEEYNKKVKETGETAGAGSSTKGDFNNINELSNYLFSTLRNDSDIKNLKFDKGFNYEHIAEAVRNRHKEDFASVTKEQLKAEFIEEYNKKVKETGGTAGAGNTPSVPTFKKEELAGLDNAAIARYFVANADGTYSFNEENIKADFPEKDYGKIDTPAKLKEAIAKKAEADKTSSVAGPGGAGAPLQTYLSGYKTWDECWQSILNGAIYNAVRTAINDDAVMKKYYEIARNQLQGELQKGFETLTKAQIQDMLITKVRELKKADDDKVGEIARYADVKDAATQMSQNFAQWVKTSDIGYGLFGANDKINTNYSINNDGTLNITDSKAKDAFDKLIKIIREAYPDAESNLGTTVLKQLVSAAWMQAANNIDDKFDFGSVTFGTFMNNVISNIKNTIQNLINHPENIELLKQKPASQVDDITSNLPHYKTPDMDDGEVVYLNGNGEIQNAATLTKIKETKDELKKRLRAAYPYLSQSTIDSMLDKAFIDALNFANSKGKGNHNVCGMTVRIRNNNDIVMSDLVDLALRYFDIELRSSGNFGVSIVSDDNIKAYNDAKAQEEADAKAAQAAKDEAAKAKYEDTKSAAAEMSTNFAQWIKTSDIGYGLFNANDNINTNFSVNKDGTLNITDSKARQAFDKLIQTIRDAYPDAVSKLGGETVLKQLVSAAWMQAANNIDDKFDFGSVPFKDFMDKVIGNMKTIINNLSSYPELLEFYTKTPASQNSDLTKNLTHYNTNDTNGDDESIIYANGYVTSPDQKDLDETKADLEAKIKKAYPHLNPNVVKNLVNNAFTDALKNLYNNKYSPTDWKPNSWNTKKHRINMDDLVNLALYYFDIELFDYISQHPELAYKE